MKNQGLLIVSGLLALSLTNCKGQDDEREETSSSTSSIISNETASSESLSANLAEALDTLSDSTMSSDSASLALAVNGELSYTFDKNCAVDGNAALVAISKSVSGSLDIERPRFTASRTVSGEATIDRVWSKEEGAVECHENGRRAAIDWTSDSISGLQLAVSFERSRDDEVLKTLTARDLEISKSISWSANGQRVISWISHTANDDGTFTRVKSVESEVARTRLVSSSSEENDINLSFTISTVADQPLQISTVRDSSTFELISHTIASGQLQTLNSDGQKIIAEFSDLKVGFSSSQCAAESGSLTASFYEADSEEAAKIVSITVSEGDYTVSDITDPDNPEEIEDFDYEVCQLANFR